MLRPEPHVAYQRLVRMFADRRASDEAAAAAVRAQLPRVAGLLVEKFGARRVVLFGSLASGLFHHARSDVDRDRGREALRTPGRRALSRRTRIADMDLMIAATAIAHDLEMVTGNLRHFDRVPGLRICHVLADARR